ncbi:zinc finger protein 90 [Trichonephila clavipes]|nr:zinc finger protein 90 [Trichonephila clavipes]
MKIITVNNYEDFSSDFPVSQDILPPLTEKDFNLSGLDSKIKSRLFQLLISHKSAFARSTVELSAAATEHHRISLQHDYPIKCPIYKIPFNLRNEFRRQITDLEEARKRSHVAAWSPPFAVTNWKGGVRPSGCQRVRQKRESESDNSGCIRLKRALFS